VQQRAGVQLKGGVGEVDDPYEQHADAVADKVVRNESAEDLLNLHAGAPRASSGATQRLAIQRQVTLGTNSTGKKNVASVKMDRSEESGVFGKSKGDHTTAHTVLRHWIENNVAGVEVEKVADCLGALYAQAMELPFWKSGGSGMKLSSGVQELALAARTRAQQGIVGWKAGVAAGKPDDDLAKLLDSALHALLNLKNCTPLAAAEFGGTGHGEGHAVKRLQDIEERLKGGKAFEKGDITTVEKACRKLLDVNRISAELEKPDPELLPGVTGNVEKDQANIALHHAVNVHQAFPRLFAEAKMSVGDVVKLILTAIKKGDDDEDYVE
jgi:hypothetical protein